MERKFPRQTALPGLLCILLVMLTACSSPTTAAAGTTRTTTATTSKTETTGTIATTATASATTIATAFTKLAVHRSATTTTQGKNFPALDKIVANAAAVTKLYAEAKALNPAGNGTYHCPASFYQVEYDAAFFQNSSAVHPMKITLAGCRFVSLDSTRYLASDDFLKLFQQTINVSTLTPSN